MTTVKTVYSSLDSSPADGDHGTVSIAPPTERPTCELRWVRSARTSIDPPVLQQKWIVNYADEWRDVPVVTA